MKSNKKHILIKLLAIILVFTLAVPCTVSATSVETVTPYASSYLSLYSAYVYVTSSGQVQVWFEVMGTKDMDEIGTLSIMLYESTDGKTWTRVKTFLHESTSGMLYSDTDYVSSHVSWQGSASKQYKAYVCVWAGKNGTGDTRYFWAYEA